MSAWKIGYDKDVGQADYALALAVLSVYAIADLVLLPALAPDNWHINLSARMLFVSAFQAVAAFIIAFPVADALLPRQRYGLFAVQSLSILAASAALLEFVLEPVFFGGRAIVAAGYLGMIEGGTAALLLTATRLLVNQRRNERRLVALQKAKAEAELQYLKGQMNPHVLFNALNNIYSHALHKSEKTPDLILNLADILRYMIYDCSADKVGLDREISFLTDYVDIQKLALDGRGDVSFQCRGDVEGKHIPPFLLIPLVENCFKHSLDTQATDIRITIDIDVTMERVRMICCNSFDPTTCKNNSSQKPGIGLANVRRRLELLFGDDFAFSAKVEGEGQVFRVVLDIPVAVECS